MVKTKSMGKSVRQTCLIATLVLGCGMMLAGDSNLAIISTLSAQSVPATPVIEGVEVVGLAKNNQADQVRPSQGVVELVRNESGWQLLRDSKPYYINGAGGAKNLEMLSQLGGNSSRTWGVDDTQETL